jgi:hypothetical protein
MILDMNRLEIIDPELPESEQLQWTGTVDEYTLANADWPMSDEEIEFLSTHGFVVIGGGAAALYVVRYATEEARESSQTFIDSCDQEKSAH